MGVILVYSIDDKTSFDNVKGWMADIKREAHEKVSIVLLGNKCDLSEKRCIQTEQGQALADEYEIQFFETSALNGTNVKDAF